MDKVRSGKMLVVDDEAIIRELSSEVLSKAGFMVDTAHDGVAGLEKIWSMHFDLVVTDIMMSKLGGMELYKQAIKERPHMEDKFVFTTGLPSSKIVNFLTETGCKYLYKPFRVNQLLDVVDSQIRPEEPYEQKRSNERFDMITDGNQNKTARNAFYKRGVFETKCLSLSFLYRWFKLVA